MCGLYIAGECSEGLCENVVCQNGGKCQVKAADSHVCLCPLGSGGENCQHSKYNSRVESEKSLRVYN